MKHYHTSKSDWHWPALSAAILACLSFTCIQNKETTKDHDVPLTVVAMGDAGEGNRIQRANASLLSDMQTGKHDGGEFSVMLFLGDNFYNIGLNIPKDDVPGKIKEVLGPFRSTLEGIGRRNVHAIPGNHDYYAANAVDVSLLFGLISFEAGPIGLSDKGNKREAEIDLWSYHWNMPASVLYPVSSLSKDSVQFIFFDSGFPLRTPSSAWHSALDSLKKILVDSRQQQGVVWRILAVHHPLYTVGEHGGYSVWNDETRRVDYLTACDRDSNAVGWVKNWLDPEDICTQKYREYVDSLQSVIASAGARIHLVLSGHDHSLQLLYRPEVESPVLPKVQVVSGAGSKTTRVKVPLPPRDYTASHPDSKNEGESSPGFVQLRFERNLVHIIFFDSSIREVLDMGGGKREFRVARDGSLVAE